MDLVGHNEIALSLREGLRSERDFPMRFQLYPDEDFFEEEGPEARLPYLDVVTPVNPARVLLVLRKFRLLQSGRTSYTGTSPQLKLLGITQRDIDYTLTFEDITEI